MYRRWKKGIKEKKNIYDNRLASITWYRARTNCLKLKDGKVHTNASTMCELCKKKKKKKIVAYISFSYVSTAKYLCNVHATMMHIHTCMHAYVLIHKFKYHRVFLQCLARQSETCFGHSKKSISNPTTPNIT